MQVSQFLWAYIIICLYSIIPFFHNPTLLKVVLLITSESYKTVYNNTEQTGC